MLERLRFSIPMSTSIDAPADVVWDALTDIASYPSTFSGVHTVEAVARRGSGDGNSSTARSGGGSHDGGPPVAGAAAPATAATAAAAAAAAAATARATRGSRWKITRISVVENQRYAMDVTCTQCTPEEDPHGKRSFTLSSHQVLGATCSLKLIVEPTGRGCGGRGDDYFVESPPKPMKPGRQDSLRKSDKSHGTHATMDTAASITHEQARADAPNEDNNHGNVDDEATPASESCRVTVILTMIPYKFFVKLLGITCCLCLLKSRARMAMECDLEDLADVCEARAKAIIEAEEGRRRMEQASNMDEGGERTEEHPQSIEIDVDRGENNGGRRAGRHKNNLQISELRNSLNTIKEEDCSTC